MMSAVAGTAQKRFRDTCAEAKLFFQGRRVLEKEEESPCLYNMNSPCLDVWLDVWCCRGYITRRNEYRRRSHLFNSGCKPDMIQACNTILDVHTKVNPSTIKGDTSKTVLFDSCILAKELKKLDKDKWKILSKVWVELLSYAACRSNANSHATHLSKGGQLISLVWLLMVHMGLGDQFEVD
ncbi:hypothetical protein Vadar_024091 [Vaccinium darrowii]|uniref:Uncharacterized protein n=1 Tax=Vaccinium darrowii TaxID=229202 RepID=A0ACB7Z6K7_9ERIC|nr:hypothetical protein Vadar_024091 [Vaccinium darrowii]